MGLVGVDEGIGMRIVSWLCQFYHVGHTPLGNRPNVGGEEEAS